LTLSVATDARLSARWSTLKELNVTLCHVGNSYFTILGLRSPSGAPRRSRTLRLPPTYMPHTSATVGPLLCLRPSLLCREGVVCVLIAATVGSTYSTFGTPVRYMKRNEQSREGRALLYEVIVPAAAAIALSPLAPRSSSSSSRPRPGCSNRHILLLLRCGMSNRCRFHRTTTRLLPARE
jgi:hypothetical protein